MPRLAVLISGCSVFLVLSWAMVAIRQASQPQFHSSSPTVLPTAKAQKEGGVGVQKEDAAKLKTRFKAPDGKYLGDRELDRNGKPKKRMGSRGISVDRKNIVETVEMDDLRAPPGRLWIPAALSGPINHDSPDDALFNVLVAYCQLDMVAYHESPWLFAMGAFHQRTSGCMDDPSLTRTYRLSSLKRVLEENPD
ncbi:unnamed protein product, partial [Ectocarpus sp. 8 AP-2014]